MPEVTAAPTGPNSAAISVTPPAVGGPCSSYELSICPVANTPGGCIPKTCGPPVNNPGATSCPVDGLTASTDYTAAATCVKADGSKLGPSNLAPFSTPPAG